MAMAVSVVGALPQLGFGQQIAQPDSSAVLPAVPATPAIDTFSVFLETVAVVAGLTLLLYFGLKWYRSAIYGKNAGRQKTQITLLGSSIIAPKKSVSVVRVLDHLLVLGLSDENMNVLLDVPVEDLSDELKQSLGRSQNVSGASFKNLLDSWMKK